MWTIIVLLSGNACVIKQAKILKIALKFLEYSYKINRWIAKYKNSISFCNFNL